MVCDDLGDIGDEILSITIELLGFHVLDFYINDPIVNQRKH